MEINLDLSTHSREIQNKYQRVLNEDPSVTWVIFGYEKGTTIKVVADGNGNLEEMFEEFEDGRIFYCFFRAEDPKTRLSKFVFLTWCGSGVPVEKKRLFGPHFEEISRLLKVF